MDAVEPPRSIGWIGLGSMGFPMANNLLRKMHPSTQFYVYDIVQDSMDRFISLDKSRVHACANPKEVASKSNTTISMVPSSPDVQEVYLHPQTGILSNPSPVLSSKLLLDSSTIDPSTSQSIHSFCATHHPTTTFLDAPVSGGVLGAEKGSLTFMLGVANSNPSLPSLTQFLGLMGDNIIPCGATPGSGLTAKLCNNYCSGLIAIAVSEAMDLGMRSGVDPRVLANVFHTSTARSAICDDWCPVPGICPLAPASKDYEGGFRVELMRKDFGLAVEAAERVGARLELGEPGLRVYEGACGDERCEGRDSRVVYRFLGGREDWREGFPEEVLLKRDETRRLVEIGKEVVEREERRQGEVKSETEEDE